jgi:hypothetical protein
MNKKIMITALLAALIGGGTGFTEHADARSKDKKWELAKPTGEPVHCISLNQIRQTRVRSDKIIDFYVGNRKIMRNELPHSCPSLGFEERFLYKTSLSQLCSVDMITVLHSAGGLSLGASCGLGKFQPMEIPK